MLLVIYVLMFAFNTIPDSDKKISVMIAENEGLSTVLTALGKAESVERLEAEGSYILFVPTNEALKKNQLW